MKEILKALNDRRQELLLARKENHIRLSELDKITMKIKKYVVDNKVDKSNEWAKMNLIIMDISSHIDDINDNKTYRKEFIEWALKKMFSRKEISNGELETALDILNKND